METLINPNLSQEEKQLEELNRISHALESIMSTLNYKFGSHTNREIINPGDEMEKNCKEAEQNNRLKEELKLTKHLAIISAIGLVISTIAIIFDIILRMFFKI